MLVFNEGMPRAGKSYDAVKSHILPALAAGRRVYARLNGLDHDKIAAHLSLPIERVRELLVLVPSADVQRVFSAVNDPAHGWTIPAHLKDALFVIDECHEFYVADRLPISPAFEQFFSLHGQNGMDGVLMSQYYRRLHSSVRCRIERKNVFQKLTAVKMKGSYLVSRYHATAPEKFELVTAETCRYDPAIFPLYSGYAPGAGNVEVYEAGGASVWRRVGRVAIFVVPLVLLGLYVLVHFFSGSGGMVRHRAAAPAAAPLSSAGRASAAPGGVLPIVAGGGNKAGSLVAEIPESEFKQMPDEVAYVFRLCSQARARLAAVGKDKAGDFGVIEWPNSGADSGVLDRLTFAQIRAMGVGIKVAAYGVRLWYRKTVVIVTSWPLAPPPASTGPSDSPPQSPSSPGVVQVTENAGGGRWQPDWRTRSYVQPERTTADALGSSSPSR